MSPGRRSAHSVRCDKVAWSVLDFLFLAHLRAHIEPIYGCVVCSSEAWLGAGCYQGYKAVPQGVDVARWLRVPRQLWGVHDRRQMLCEGISCAGNAAIRSTAASINAFARQRGVYTSLRSAISRSLSAAPAPAELTSGAHGSATDDYESYANVPVVGGRLWAAGTFLSRLFHSACKNIHRMQSY